MEQVQAILANVEELPASPTLLPRLLPYLGDVNGNFEDVVQIISLEQTLTAKLLQICNSAFFGQEQPISTVAEAVNRVGYQSVFLLVSMINGSSSFLQPSANAAEAGQLWKHSVAVAFHTKFVAESAGIDGNLMLTAGLMHDIGKLVLMQNTGLKSGVEFHQPSTPDSLAAEQRAFGCHHADLGAALLEKWKLPVPLIYSVRYHHDPPQAGHYKCKAACVAIGNAIAHSELRPQSIASGEFKAAMAQLGLIPDDMKKWRKKFDEAGDLIAGMSQLPL